ncbi:hypothetical protein [Streptacidiphilus sp. EB129]|uniref:hypothetical protein n=1 Tax=Streptacidiphilus sp. EB129 TaxID=3156262 RepID=UPI003515F9F0
MTGTDLASLPDHFAIAWHDALGSPDCPHRGLTVQTAAEVTALLRAPAPTEQLHTAFPDGSPALTVTPLHLDWRTATEDQARAAAGLAGT